MDFVRSRGYHLMDAIVLDKAKAVYKCRHNEMSEMCALKWIKWDGDEEAYKQLIREKEICVALKHQNIVKFVKSFESPLVNGFSHNFYQVMELCRCDLSDWFQENRNRSLQMCFTMINEIISGLSYLHSNNIMHRDLKPLNILISFDGICKLADFGLVKKHIKTVTNGHTSGIGTELYAAPELRLNENTSNVVNEGAYNLKVDVYSLAIILLEFFTIFYNSKEILNAIQNYITLGSIPEIFFGNFDKNINKYYFDIIKDLILKMTKTDPKLRIHLNDVKHYFHNIHLKLYIENINHKRNVTNILLAKYPVFNQIYSEIICSKFIYIYIQRNNEYLILINNEIEKTFYEIRVNELFDTIIEKKRYLNSLTNSTIIDIACGYEHVICLTENSHVFAWGNNSCGQLGNGSRNDNNTPTIVEALKNKDIVSISCGEWHTLAMTRDGNVYVWGWNHWRQLGIDSDDDCITTPTLMQTSFRDTISPILDERIITAISCAAMYSLALTKIGSVFVWGHQRCGDGSSVRMSATRVKVENNVVIKKICCGRVHTLLLTIEGDVYSFGGNDCGQLGRQSAANNSSVATKIESSVKFCDIYSNFEQNISIALSESRKCFVWGECGEERVYIPRETHFESINETILFYSNNKTTLKAIML